MNYEKCQEIESQLDFETRFFQNFQQFLGKEHHTSTYKFVFLKSLLYLSGEKNAIIDINWDKEWIHRNGKKLIVDLEFVAVPFTKYYWDMFFKYRLKQSPTKNQFYTCKDCNTRQETPNFIKGISKCKNCNSLNLKNNDQDVNIHKNFKDAKGEPIIPPKCLKDIAKDHVLLNNVIHGNTSEGKKSSFTQVLFALNKKGFYNEIPNFYSRSSFPKNTRLEFDIRIIDLFSKFRITLENSINFGLTKYLESINKSPKIAEKILLDPKRPKLKPDKIEQMLKYNPNGRDRCFYCNETSDESFAVDHVIPFDYVLDTDLFNSVPACKSCNSVKSNRLPDYKTNFKLVLARNEKMNLEFYDSNSFDKLYDDCLREYHGDRDFFINKYKK